MLLTCRFIIESNILNLPIVDCTGKDNEFVCKDNKTCIRLEGVCDYVHAVTDENCDDGNRTHFETNSDEKHCRKLHQYNVS